MGLETLLRERNLYDGSVQARLEFGRRVINEMLYLAEGMAEAYPAFKRVLSDPYKAGIAGVILANNVEKVSEVTKLPPSVIQEAVQSGEGVISYMRKKLYESAGLLKEATTTSDIGDWDALYMGVTAFLFPSLVASNFVSIQPLTAPTGVIFYKTYQTDETTPQVLDKNTIANQPGSSFASETIGTGDGTTTSFNATLSNTPVIPGTLSVIAGSVILDDKGDGTLEGAGSGTINYETGQVSVTFNTAPASGTAIVAEYYSSQENKLGAKVKISLEKDVISAVSRKLSYEWTTEAAQDMMAYHGIAIEDDVANTFVNVVAGEIDREIIRQIRLRAIAQGVIDATWSQTPASGVSYNDHKTGLLSEMRKVYAKIVDNLGTYMDGATPFAVCGVDAWSIVQDIATFSQNPDIFAGKGSSGQLGEFAVYYSPFMPASEMIVGIHHPDLTLTGFVYAPYRIEISPPVNSVTTDGSTVEIDPHKFKKGVLSRDGFKVVRPQMYARITITP